MADLHKAIRAIHNNVVSINGDTQADIQAIDDNNQVVTIDWTQVNAWQDPQAYQYKRQQAYESIKEQLDMLYWDKINGTNNWETMITTVKNLYPKPTE
jgi:hypothetical protein